MLENRLLLSGAGTDHNTVAGNLIGRDLAGTVALGNGRNGVYIADGAHWNLIGTDGNGISDEEEGNLISSNAGSGVAITTTSGTFEWPTTAGGNGHFYVLIPTMT